jgi:tripartite-type tricarboxylate transporter receptor subunit TctC
MAEAGFPGFDTTAWFGLLAPAATAAAIIDKLNRETVRVLSLPDVRKWLYDLGMEVIAGTPAECAVVMRSEILQWAKVIKDAGIKLSE